MSSALSNGPSKPRHCELCISVSILIARDQGDGINAGLFDSRLVKTVFVKPLLGEVSEG